MNYRLILEKHWQQYFPGWKIPIGFIVHHIKPKCTFEDKNDPLIHHYTNLIALHPDDHYTIHKLRGDTVLNEGFMLSIKGRIHDPESKKKMVLTKIKNGTLNHSDATKYKISKSKKGKPGHKLSQDAKNKISKIHKGKITSDDVKRKMSISSTGKKHTNESKKKMSKRKMGHKHSEATKRKMVVTALSMSIETKNKISNARQGKRLFNNGTQNILCVPGSEPFGFILGKLYNAN